MARPTWSAVTSAPNGSVKVNCNCVGGESNTPSTDGVLLSSGLDVVAGVALSV
jgi:hypothetical protein